MTTLKQARNWLMRELGINMLLRKLGIKPPLSPKAKRKVFHSSRARRPIGFVFDELSRGLNPFSFIETAGLADVTDTPESIAEKFNRFGIVKVRRVNTPQQADNLYRYLQLKTELAPEDLKAFIARKPIFKESPDNWRSVQTWEKKWLSEWGGGGFELVATSGLSKFLFSDSVKEIVFATIGRNIFEIAPSVTIHHSYRGLHRSHKPLLESVSSPYSPRSAKKQFVRVVQYVGPNGGSVGYVPFSHSESLFKTAAAQVGFERDLSWFEQHPEVLKRAKLTKNFMQADHMDMNISWLHADPGDIIIFNPAMYHCDNHLTGPKYSIVATFAEYNRFTLPLASNLVKKDTAAAKAYFKSQSNNGFLGAENVYRQAVEIDKINHQLWSMQEPKVNELLSKISKLLLRKPNPRARKK